MSRDMIRRSFIETGIQQSANDEDLHSKLQSCLAGSELSELDDDMESNNTSDLENYAEDMDETKSDIEEGGEDSNEDDSDTDCEIVDK